MWSVRGLVGVVALTIPISAQTEVATGIELDAVTDQRLEDTDGDGRQELIVLRGAGSGLPSAVLRIGMVAESRALALRGEIALRDPAHTLIAYADVLPTPGVEVVVADPRGTECRPWPGTAAAGSIAAESTAVKSTAAVVLARGARFTVRVGQPRISPFVRDLNEDGELDLLLPTLQSVRPYLHEGRDGDGTPRYRRMAAIPVPVEVGVDPGSRGLDQELVGSIKIPTVKTKDVNGDGRPDLLTKEEQRYGYHLQDAEGRFAPPIEVDIGQFEDSTPKAAVELGSTVVLGDRQLLQDGDINGDGIPDYVIAHRRKIWTFLADESGPQFRKARTQAVAEDVTAMLLADIDNDERADLLTFRVRLPGLGELLLALVRSIDIDIRAVGYQSAADGFARAPKWRRVVTLRVPPLLSLLSRQDELVERFTKEIARDRAAVRGGFHGAAELDLAVARADGDSIELYADVGEAPKLTSAEGRELLRRLLFEDENTVFDIDRVFGLISGLLDTLSERTVGDRQPFATIALRSGSEWRLIELLAGDLDGAPGDELIAVYEATAVPGRRAFDVLAWER